MTRSLATPALRLVSACFFIAATAPATAEPACDAAEADLRFNLAVSLDDTAEGAVAQGFAQAADTALQGRYCITLHPDAALFGNDAALFAALKSGEVAFAVLPTDALLPLAPTLALIDLPFLFDTPQHVISYLQSGAAAPLLADVADDGMAAFGILATGTRQLVGPTAILAPEDAAGLAFALADPGPQAAALISALGGGAADVPADQMSAALQSGAVQGVAATWHTIDFDYLYAPPAIVTETNHGVTALILVGSSTVIAALSAQDRKVLDDVMQNALHRQSVLAFERAQISRQVVVDDGGRIVPLSADERAAFRTHLAPLLDAARASIGAELIDAAIAANTAMTAQQ